ncbi:MAG: hypothetical protein A3B91_00790 [Candidatus Yanofskybacteria bacterium RIFCSPHIGHO2_02_FULL_41_29]|uniref:Uncharacterized protein n=1 Tax=Candidatus Yanofskybacteria bacterium RIFCSPHIGHO2_01_FULL_41_53 TaxID=1802663 RepID=A0A1F8EL90_9BACT|nr:MAG: hypothetical protein A2650_00360 [Candidatus Yanofskybacteria bacterium RIFCSPHIGHO2_01_FULL_41_53]OGN12279.1 MAG: hypothetical protein A3B91_00790 [Candidatus Yanofskybacteria bacterium RIFCSPHIGHO2_02_FULL_41_29]OGN17016.1 MAG: hypothetical protein A3F48_03660 [Candidatus Yanofskybacteria bacterium RIFCSPHIGHO2_12_FULL_41_9]OGN23622.1 MAG: hypothetical protein A2916_01525 [Candidatus Yanofskybacteria bacterium RIFCSPLOWO2_01_FULL_41_67]OGN29391.1 MAG: hypothetical protein A3H54_04000 
MAEDSKETVDAILCFDANLPKMHTCSDKCEGNYLILCRHRFNFNAKILYCNTPQFYKWPDSEILLYFLDYIKNGISDGLIPVHAIFTILTKDTDFLRDAESELGRKAKGNGIDFLNSSIVNGDLVIYIKQVDCKNYGSKGNDNLKCAIYKMNKFFKKLN